MVHVPLEIDQLYDCFLQTFTTVFNVINYGTCQRFGIDDCCWINDIIIM